MQGLLVGDKAWSLALQLLLDQDQTLAACNVAAQCPHPDVQEYFLQRLCDDQPASALAGFEMVLQVRPLPARLIARLLHSLDLVSG